MHSSTVVRYIDIEGDQIPSYGCGIDRKKLKDTYEMKVAKKQNLCLDWLYGGCVYRDGRNGSKRTEEMCKFFHELPPKKTVCPKAVPTIRPKVVPQTATKAPKPSKIKIASDASPWNTNRVRSFWVNEGVQTTLAKPAMSLSAGSETTPTTVSCDDCSSAAGSKAHVPMREASPEIGVEEADLAEFVVVVEEMTTNPSNESPAEPVMNSPSAPVVPPVAPEPNSASLPTPQTYAPQDYEPAPVQTNFFDSRNTLNPQLLALNANAPEYNPSVAHEYPGSASYSHSGSLASEDLYTVMSTSHTPAPKRPQLYYAPPVSMPMYIAQPGYTMQTSAPVHSHAAAYAMVQEKNAQLTAEVRAYKASQDQIHSEYQMELTKYQNETAVLARSHDRAMKEMASEQKKLRLQYERQLAALRKKAEEAAAAAKQKQEALEKEMLERAKEQAVKRVSIQTKADVIPNEEVVLPADENTYFTAGPLTSLVETTQPASTPLIERQPTPYQAQSAEVAPAKKPLGQRKRRVRRRKVVAEVPVEAAAVEKPVAEVEATPVAQVQMIEPEVVAEPLVPIQEATLSPETTPEALNVHVPMLETPVQTPIAPSAVPTSIAPPAVSSVAPPAVCSVAPPAVQAPVAPPLMQAPIAPRAGAWGKTHTQLKAKLPAKAPQSLVKPAVKVVKQAGNRCIRDVFDWKAAQKEGICWYYFMGLCKSTACDCDKSGCSLSLPCTCFIKDAPKCTRHTWGREYGHNCAYKHKKPTVSRTTTKTKQLSKEERKYRERQSGVKKTRMSKRDRLNRANRLSLEEAKRRRDARRRLY